MFTKKSQQYIIQMKNLYYLPAHQTLALITQLNQGSLNFEIGLMK